MTNLQPILSNASIRGGGMKKRLLLLLWSVSLGFVACENEGPAERAGEKIDEAVEEAGDQVEKAADKVEEATD